MQSKYYSLSFYSTSVMKWYVLLSYRFVVVCVKVMMFTFSITSLSLCVCCHFCPSFSFVKKLVVVAAVIGNFMFSLKLRDVSFGSF